MERGVVISFLVLLGVFFGESCWMRSVSTMLFIFVTIITTSSNWQGDMTAVFSYYIFLCGCAQCSREPWQGGGLCGCLRAFCIRGPWQEAGSRGGIWRMLVGLGDNIRWNGGASGGGGQQDQQRQLLRKDKWSKKPAHKTCNIYKGQSCSLSLVYVTFLGRFGAPPGCRTQDGPKRRWIIFGLSWRLEQVTIMNMPLYISLNNCWTDRN